MDARVRGWIRAAGHAALAAAALAAVAASGGAARADAGVSGRVEIAGHGPARDAVVCLTPEGEAKRTAPLAHAVVDQRAKTFIPHVCVVPVGTTVQFPNNDTVFHNVFAYYNAKKFDLGMYPRGATKRVTFDKPGLVALLCNVHSEMSAYVMVVDTPYYAVTGRDGRFRIAAVPPGRYTAHVWHESGATLAQEVSVSAGAAPLDFSLSRK